MHILKKNLHFKIPMKVVPTFMYLNSYALFVCWLYSNINTVKRLNERTEIKD